MLAKNVARPLLLSAVALATAASLVSCQGLSKSVDESDQAVGLPVDAPRVTVLDAGQGERSVLTYSDIDGDSQDVTATVADGFAQSVSTAGQVDSAAPAQQLGGGSTISLPLSGSTSAASSPPGDDQAEREASRAPEFTVGAATIDDQSLLPSLRSAEGFRFGWRGNDSGEISTLQLLAPEDADDDGRAMTEGALMKLMSLPVVFPSEEIGTGARWTVDARVAGDASLLQTVTFTLKSHESSHVDLGVEVAQRPSLGALSLAGMEGASGETQLTVESSNTASSGSLTVDLSKPLPVSGEVAYTTRVVYADSGDQRIVQDTSTRLAFR